MQILLYHTEDENNKLNKTLETLATLEVQLKDEVNVLTPVLMMRRQDYYINVKANYAYIADFGRYYYIRDVKLYSNDLVVLYLTVDVLQSFKEDIKNIEVITKRQETLGNDYLVDGRLKLLNYPEIKVKNFPVGFNENFEYVLITTGGEA